MRFQDVSIPEKGNFKYRDGARDMNASACFPLFLIHEAWGEVSFDDLCDGYGAGEGDHGDWSGIRDSSDEALAQMFERALNHFFGGASNG